MNTALVEANEFIGMILPPLREHVTVSPLLELWEIYRIIHCLDQHFYGKCRCSSVVYKIVISFGQHFCCRDKYGQPSPAIVDCPCNFLFFNNFFTNSLAISSFRSKSDVNFLKKFSTPWGRVIKCRNITQNCPHTVDNSLCSCVLFERKLLQFFLMRFM